MNIDLYIFITKRSHRTHSANTCVYSPLPVPCLRDLLGEEEIDFIVVSVVVVWDEVSCNELRICRGKMEGRSRETGNEGSSLAIT